MSEKLSIPVAIVVAGAIIAGAIYFTRDTSNQVANTDAVVTQYTINMPSVSDDDHIRGNPDAPIKIVEYSDTECPFCKVFHNTLTELMETYGKNGEVAWVYRHFPIVSLHSKAPKESEATECVARDLGEEAFWSYLDSIYLETKSNDSLESSKLYELAEAVGMDRTALLACLNNGDFTEKVSNAVKVASSAGGRGTPYSVLELNYELSDDQIIALNSLNDQVTGGEEKIIRADEVSKDRVSVYGAFPIELMKAILDIVKG